MWNLAFLPGLLSLLVSFNYVTKPNELQILRDSILDESNDYFCLDLEAENQMNHYHTRICLMQFKVGDQITIVDPQSPQLKKSNHLKELFIDISEHKKTLLMHGCDYDLRLLSEFYSFIPYKIFDTMIGATVLNYEKKGLGALVENEFNVKLDKKFQKANWNTRPLSQEMLQYAAIDVIYLERLKEIMVKVCVV